MPCGERRHAREQEGELDVRKVRGEDNPADVATKHVTGDKLDKFTAMSSQEFREGRADKRLQLKIQEDV